MHKQQTFVSQHQFYYKTNKMNLATFKAPQRETMKFLKDIYFPQKPEAKFRLIRLIFNQVSEKGIIFTDLVII